MEHYNELIHAIALAMGASWASGINLYATLLVLGIGATQGVVALPSGLEMLANPLVIAAAALMYVVEFFADKTPGVDTAWDGIHTFVRIPAGALLAAGAVGEISPTLAMAAAIVGGGMSASTHAAKAGSRVMINTSPEPFSNWGASIGEDVLVVAGLWTALHYPTLFIVLLILFVLFLIWALPKLWRAIKRAAGFIGRMLRFGKKEFTSSPQPNEALVLLERLYQKGAISHEEYQKEKEKLLHVDS